MESEGADDDMKFTNGGLAILSAALERYQPRQSEAVLVGGKNVVKPALRLMTSCRLVIGEIKDAQAITSYTQW